MPVTQRDDLHHDAGHADAHDAEADHPSPEKKKADGAGGDAAIKRMAGASMPKAKDGGMLTAETQSKLGVLAKGTAVEVVAVKGDKLSVKVWSGHAGATTDVPLGSFQMEPALAMKDDSPGQRDDYTYEQFTSVLWGPGGPSAGDVRQGYLGDCYFNAAMGAVAAANPGKIKSLFAPQKANLTSYQVTLHTAGRDGKLAPKTVTVDTNLPTKVKSDTSLVPAYSGASQNFAQHDAPLWPALLEKAYAQMTRGGYAKIGDGGLADVAMQTLTGEESHDQSDTFAKSPKKILEKFKQLQAAGAAVCCGTLSGIPLKGAGGFTGTGDGPYHADLKDSHGSAAELVHKSLLVRDKKGKGGTAHDNGEGKLIGANVAAGNVRYGSGAVDLTYEKGKGPTHPEDLSADFEWEGMIAPEFGLYGDHEYIFESVQGDSLVFKNPWGESHPKPIPAARFKELFDEMSANPTKPPKPKGA
ncbi:MAG: hypothetical protein EXR72_14805 [Myxococcales bacterium]|nr:hypothetical protein [Myxococcales bacterium]